MEFLDSITAVIIGLSAGTLATVAVVLEFVLHRIPSKKPLGLLHLAAGGMRKVAKLGEKIAALAEALANALDKVVPQKKD